MIDAVPDERLYGNSYSKNVSSRPLGEKRAHNVCDLYLALILQMDFMWEGIKSGEYFSTSAQINKMCSKPEPFKSSLNPESL